MWCFRILTAHAFFMLIFAHSTALAQVSIAAINTGGPEYTDSQGKIWEADSLHAYYQTGSTISIVKKTNATILGTADVALYQTDRTYLRSSVSTVYEIPVPTAGEYIVTLHFAEINPMIKSAGLRIFDIWVEDLLRYAKYDIFAVAGGAWKATTVTVRTTVSDGSLKIDLKRVKWNPKISAISVVLVEGFASFQWQPIATRGILNARHEACFVMVGNQAYLIGGRRISPIDVYNPSTSTWTQEPGPGVMLHHMQCVVADDKIWIISSWTGKCCNEQNVPMIYVYDTFSKQWQTKNGLPEARRRGGAAAVLYDRDIYLVGGNRGGHGTGIGLALAWLDKYNIDTDTWTMNLPNAPRVRDHTGGGIVNGKLCIASGRNSGAINYFNATVLPTDCFNFGTSKWEVHASIPQGRAGAAVGTSCDGKLIVAGGEGYGRAWDRVDVFDGLRWQTIPSLQSARHGTGLAIDCVRNQMFIASGSGAQGGSPELKTTETYSAIP